MSADVVARDRQHNGNVRKLARTFKQWRRHCDVPIKSFQLEALVKEALPPLGYGWRDDTGSTGWCATFSPTY